MNLACPQCGAPITLEASFCSACGRPADANRDGVPDALEQLIEAKARGIIAADRQAEQAARLREEADKEIQALHAKTTEIEQKLHQNAGVSRAVPLVFLRLVRNTTILVAVAWLVFGAVPHIFLFGAIGYSPAGFLLCPMQCSKCEGPGRVYSWNFRGSWQDNKGRMGYALVCHNPKIDADTLSPSTIRSSPMNDALQPYLVNGTLAFLGEGVVLAPLSGLLAGLLGTGRKRRSLDAEREKLLQERTATQRRLASLHGAAPPLGSPFRDAPGA